MNAVRILVGSGFGTAAVWVVATIDPYLAFGAGAVGAGVAVGVQRALGPEVCGDANGENDVETGSGGDDADSEIGLRHVDFDGAVAALVTLLVVLAGSLFSGGVAGRTGATIADALVVLGVFGYSLFGLLVPGFGLAGFGGAAVGCRVVAWVGG